MSGQAINNFNGWGVTIIDSLDTLVLMGLKVSHSFSAISLYASDPTRYSVHSFFLPPLASVTRARPSVVLTLHRDPRFPSSSSYESRPCLSDEGAVPPYLRFLRPSLRASAFL